MSFYYKKRAFYNMEKGRQKPLSFILNGFSHFYPNYKEDSYNITLYYFLSLYAFKNSFTFSLFASSFNPVSIKGDTVDTAGFLLPW